MAFEIEIHDGADQPLIDLAAAIDEIVEAGGVAKVVVTKKATRTLAMNKLWHGFWMPQTAEWMKSQGVKVEIKNQNGDTISSRYPNAKDAHEMFVMHWLGLTDEGLRELTRDMQKGRMLYLMDKHSQWAVEKGLLLTYPSDSEYNTLKQQTES